MELIQYNTIENKKKGKEPVKLGGEREHSPREGTSDLALLGPPT